MRCPMESSADGMFTFIGLGPYRSAVAAIVNENNNDFRFLPLCRLQLASDNGRGRIVCLLAVMSSKADDTAGKKESGMWKLDSDGAICVAWPKLAKVNSGCFKVNMEGSAVTWMGKRGVHRGELRGEVVPLSLAGGMR